MRSSRPSLVRQGDPAGTDVRGNQRPGLPHGHSHQLGLRGCRSVETVSLVRQAYERDRPRNPTRPVYLHKLTGNIDCRYDPKKLTAKTRDSLTFHALHIAGGPRIVGKPRPVAPFLLSRKVIGARNRVIGPWGNDHGFGGFIDKGLRERGRGAKRGKQHRRNEFYFHFFSPFELRAASQENAPAPCKWRQLRRFAPSLPDGKHRNPPKKRAKRETRLALGSRAKLLAAVCAGVTVA